MTAFVVLLFGFGVDIGLSRAVQLVRGAFGM